MMQPLALIVYENLLPGTQIVNRLQDLNYRVLTLNDADALVTRAENAKPMLVIADLSAVRERVAEVLKKPRQNPPTRHLPVIAFGPDADSQNPNQTAALPEGVTLLVGASAILNHLPQLLEQALQVE
jgi:CheY-like chemotaxis protein